MNCELKLWLAVFAITALILCVGVIIINNTVFGETYQGPPCTYQGNCNGHHGFMNSNLPIINLENTHGDSIVKRFLCSIIC